MKKSKTNKKPKLNSNKINLDNEIIIGITPKKQEKKPKGKGGVPYPPKKPISKKKNTGTGSKSAQIKKKTNIDEKTLKKRKIRAKIIKWTSLGIFILTAVILFLLSSIFNIREIKVNNNSKISELEIISLSEIKKDENMFKLNIGKIKESIKKNPYIEKVEIKRNLNGTININVEEREATYMLEFANSYVYINNQGYILEKSQEKLEVPMISGFSTKIEDIEEGRRLIESDLIKLGTVIKITDVAKGNNIIHLITNIDISDDKNYKITLTTEGKIVYFGDESKIIQKIRLIVFCIQDEKGIEGELFLNNINKPRFREKVR